MPVATEAGCLIADAVTVSYGTEGGSVLALRAVSLRLRPGDFVALRGPSGSGKTTLLHCLGGLVTPTTGEVRWDGQRLSGLDLDARIGTRAAAFAYLFQGGNLLPTFTAAENVAFAAFVSGRPPGAESSLALGRLGLEAKRAALPDALSGGEQQRVALARAVAQGARVLLADEPTGQLDRATAIDVLDLIDDLRRADPTLIIVLATHDPAVANRTGRVIEIIDGRIPAAGAE